MKSSKNKTTPNNPSWFQVHKKLTITLCVFVGLYFISLFIPFISNFTQFPLHVIKCGGLPLVANGGGSYITPDSLTYNVGPLNTGFFCTEQEAQAAGYRQSFTN